jgi:hypothetical protein
VEDRAKAGQWVEIETVVLRSRDRVAKLPADTQAVDLVARVRGFLLDDARSREQARIRTILGHEVTGKLRSIDPPVPATFGRPAPELLEIGGELRSILATGEETE